LKKNSSDLRSWTIRDSADLYQVEAWGKDFFAIDAQGSLCVRAPKDPAKSVSLFRLVEDLKERGHELPLLLRFSDILQHRVEQLCGVFADSIREYGYKGSYRPVYPIKVNQQRDVVEELVWFGREHRLGLEAGSKPELLVALAYLDTPGALIVCNGYKDVPYIETALLAQKLGRYPLIVIDRLAELETVIQVSRRLQLRPHIGVRARLASRGAGKWFESSGDKSKFGLTSTELVELASTLRAAGMLDCLEMLHFHIGSQITAIRAIKDALRESSRIYAELHQLGAGLKFLDVGGGLAVDYDGSKTNFASSANYSLREYANDVVSAVLSECDDLGIPHPDIVSESGRALVAHHAMLVLDVLGTDRVNVTPPPPTTAEHKNETIRELFATWQGVTRKNFQESFHDALEFKDQCISLFNLGYLDLEGRALAENIFWAVCEKIQRIVAELEYVPDELEGLQRALADNYYCNFSVFQSLPDHWAVKQLFPVMPIHRLREEPTRRAVLSDLTCDSDGKVDRFIDLRDVKEVVELHPFEPGQPYYLGVFLVGAYQEVLGDLHNLFGDTNAIHVALGDDGDYKIERVVQGDAIDDVLRYMQYERSDLVRRVREAAEDALRRGAVQLRETSLLLNRFRDGLAGYTYLSSEADAELRAIVLPANGGAAQPGSADGAGNAVSAG
jgi:arginine decarboxylase